MKIEPLFMSENNALVRISDGKIIDTSKTVKLFAKEILDENAALPAEKDTPIGICISWEEVDMGGGTYNENLLAALHDYLRTLDESGFCAIIIPSTTKKLEDAEDAEEFISAFVHTARRIKDCRCVSGFAIAPCLLEKDAASPSLKKDAVSSSNGTTAPEKDADSFAETSLFHQFSDEMKIKHRHYAFFAERGDLERLSLEDKAAAKGIILI